jgi:hypothetical protein
MLIFCLTIRHNNKGAVSVIIYERSATICEPLDIEVKKPRICGRQIMRDNVEAECPEDYFRKSITVPFLYCTLPGLSCIP